MRGINKRYVRSRRGEAGLVLAVMAQVAGRLRFGPLRIEE